MSPLFILFMLMFAIACCILLLVKDKLPYRTPFTPFIKRCDHVNDLGESLPSTYTAWAKTIIGTNRPVFTECAGWDWYREHPYPTPFDSVEDIKVALLERRRKIIHSTCSIIQEEPQ